MTEDRGKMLYCSCDAFIGRTGTPPDCGKTVEIMPRGCNKCSREAFEKWIKDTDKRNPAYPLLERSGEEYLDLYVTLKWQGWKAAKI